MRVPRWGVHNGIKFNQKRTIISFCIRCGKVIIKPTRGKKICSDECRKENNYNHWYKWYENLNKEDKKLKAGTNYNIQYIKKINKWNGFDGHHIYPKSLYPEFTKESWNIIPISEKMHYKFHDIKGMKLKYQIDYYNEIVNFIYDELHNNNEDD